MLFTSVARSLPHAGRRAFSTTSSRLTDVAKLTLVGRLGKVPESRQTKNGKDYVLYVVGTTNQPGPPREDGTRDEPKTSWHNILSFSPGSNNYLLGLSKGSLVYVEANYELHEPEAGADPTTPQGQRQIFLRHDNIKVLKKGQESSADATSF